MTLNKIVENVLSNSVDARNNDKRLMIEVFEAKGLYFSERQKEKIMQLPSVESITRMRRKIQQEGKYKATEKVQKMRKIKATELKILIPKIKAKYLNMEREFEND